MTVRPNILHLTHPNDHERLIHLAKTYVWWKAPQQSLANPDLFLGQLMTYGTWDDAFWTLDLLGHKPFKRTLANAQPGIFNERSWTFWHIKLGIDPIPPLPRRSIPA